MNENKKFKKFYVEWWNIRRSTIYAVIATVVLGSTIAYGVWYATKNDWFRAAVEQEAPKDAARILSFEGDVRITRAATRETIVVTKPTYVAAGDTVQTQADGRAIIEMIDGSVYSVRPNSTVVIRDTTSIFGGKNVRVGLNGGQLNVRTEDQPEDTRNIVEVAEAEVSVGPKTDASFNSDGQSGEIRVSRGGVETTLAGETASINANEYAAVNGGRLSARERLLAPPVAASPENSAQLVDGGSGVAVAFSWQDADGSAGASSYALQVAKSPWFSSDAMMIDRSGLAAREFRLAGLGPGTYYWRVKATARSGQTTNWNDTSKFMVIRRDSNVAIDLGELKVENFGGGVYMVNGRTSPGMAVRAQGRETFAAADGSFKLQIASQSAETAVEIGDDRGNRKGFIISLRTGNLLRRY